MNGILISQPIGTFDSIVHMPPPIILVHISKCGVYTSLCGNGVTPSRKELRYTSGIKPCFSQAESRSKSRPAGTNNEGIILVVLYDIY